MNKRGEIQPSLGLARAYAVPERKSWDVGVINQVASGGQRGAAVGFLVDEHNQSRRNSILAEV